jgi:hypothetical protein
MNLWWCNEELLHAKMACTVRGFGARIDIYSVTSHLFIYLFIYLKTLSMGGKRNACKIFVGETWRKTIGRPRRRWRVILKWEEGYGMNLSGCG